MASGYDTVWYCSGAAFRVHKFVLAAFSDHMKVILLYMYNFLIFYITALHMHITITITSLNGGIPRFALGAQIIATSSPFSIFFKKGKIFFYAYFRLG